MLQLDYVLPIIFMMIMGLSLLVYVILDGYDLGVGMLVASTSNEEKRNQMIASIGPFWDANETWLVLGVGILLVAFPKAHGIVLTKLFLPTTTMIWGLILRGVCYGFRAKVYEDHRLYWDRGFAFGSTLASFSQGLMLGYYLMGFKSNIPTHIFATGVGFFVCAGYIYMGASWLIMKTEHELQLKAIDWASISIRLILLGLIFVSITTPLLEPRLFALWFSIPTFFVIAPVPLAAIGIVLFLPLILNHLKLDRHYFDSVPFIGGAFIFLLCFLGLAFSFYPYIIPNQMTIWQGAASTESLWMIFIAVCIVLPMIIGYNILLYWAFHGKVDELRYD